MADEYPQPIKHGDVFPAHKDPVSRAEREAFIDNDNFTGFHGFSVISTGIPGKCIITAAVPSPSADTPPHTNAVTIGEALDTAAETAADRAVQAAGRRATGKCGGVSAAAQRAAELNERVGGDEKKVKMGEVVGGATERYKGVVGVSKERV